MRPASARLLAALATASLLAGGLAAPAGAADDAFAPNTPLEIEFRHSGLLAGVENASLEPDAKLVQMADVSPARHDDFFFQRVGPPVGPARYLIRSRHSGLYLTPVANRNGEPVGGILQQRPLDHDSRRQRWHLEPATDHRPWQHLISDATGLALTVEGGSRAEGARVVLMPVQRGPEDDVFLHHAAQ